MHEFITMIIYQGPDAFSTYLDIFIGVELFFLTLYLGGFGRKGIPNVLKRLLKVLITIGLLYFIIYFICLRIGGYI